MIKSKRVRWAKDVAHMEDKSIVFRVLVEKEGDHYKDLDLDRRII
jgi:hypothetical protein